MYTFESTLSIAFYGILMVDQTADRYELISTRYILQRYRPGLILIQATGFNLIIRVTQFPVPVSESLGVSGLDLSLLCEFLGISNKESADVWVR